jgi:hypothetical protein
MIGKWCIIDIDNDKGEFFTGQVIEQIGETHFLINVWTKNAEHSHQRLVPISVLSWETRSAFFNTAADMEKFVEWIEEPDETEGPKVVILEKK